MNTLKAMIIRQAMQMIEDQNLQGWTEVHDEVILEILKEKLNENA